MLWEGEHIVAQKTVTVIIVDIVFNPGTEVYRTNYQLKFSDGTWLITESLSIVESSLKIGHSYNLSLMKKRAYINWFITNVTEVQTP